MLNRESELYNKLKMPCSTQTQTQEKFKRQEQNCEWELEATSLSSRGVAR